MPTYLTGDPGTVARGERVVGRPYDHLPVVLLCTVPGERWCGWRRTAKTEADILTMTAEKRDHEAGCKGGLIVARAGEHG